jgi:hypothetical protein
MKEIAIAFLFLSMCLICCKEDAKVSTESAGMNIKADSIKNRNSLDSFTISYNLKLNQDRVFLDSVESAGMNIKADTSYSQGICPAIPFNSGGCKHYDDGHNFFDLAPLELSVSLIRQILADGNKEFECEVSEDYPHSGGEPVLVCNIRADSFSLEYDRARNRDSEKWILDYLRTSSEGIILYEGKIKIGMSWEKFLETTGADAEYQESKNHCFITDSNEHWFCFINGVLREVTYFLTI